MRTEGNFASDALKIRHLPTKGSVSEQVGRLGKICPKRLIRLISSAGCGGGTRVLLFPGIGSAIAGGHERDTTTADHITFIRTTSGTIQSFSVCFSLP